jgi:hypothetical protein
MRRECAQWDAESLRNVLKRHAFVVTNERLLTLLVQLLNEQLPPPSIPFTEDARVVWKEGWRPSA